MDFAPEVLANLRAVNMAHLRSLEQGHDILALHPRCITIIVIIITIAILIVVVFEIVMSYTHHK